MPRIVELHTYPVKGCAGVALPSAELTPAGLAHDRTFMVTDPDGVFRSQRREPRLALIQPEIGAGGGLLVLRAPGAGTLSVLVNLTAVRKPVRLFRTRYRGIDQGDAAADWLTAFLGAPSRLVRVPPEHDRVTDGETPGTSGYADSSAVLLTTAVSLAGLNDRIAARGAAPVPMRRFRPNIVVDGWDGPHAEDRARAVSVGEAELGYAKLAIRCAVTLVDPRSGVRAGPEPLRTLAEYRRAPGGGVAFGAKFSVLRPGWLSVGDEAAVTAWGESPLR